VTGRDLPGQGLTGQGATAPLSFAQEGCWHLSRLLPDDTSYNIRAGLRLRGELDVEALRRALADRIARQEILRTTYHESDGGAPVQVVGGLPATVLLELDLGDVPPDCRESEAMRLVLAEVDRPIDLTAGPVHRTVLVRLSPSEHLLVQVSHHIAVDWLSSIVADWELGTLYAAHAAGRTAELPPLRAQYRHYAERERAHAGGPAMRRGLGYWRTKLAGAPGGPRVCPGYRDPAAAVLEAAMVKFPLPTDAMRRLIALARAERTTPFVVTLATWAATLFRHTGQDDMVLVSDVSTRANSQFEGLIGMFVNAIALRVQTDGGLSFRQLVARVRRTVMESVMHAVPFQRIVEESHSGRDWGWDWKHLNHLGFVVHPYGTESSRRAGPDWGLELRWLSVPVARSHVELNMHLVTTLGGDWWGHLTYRPRTMPAAAAARLAGGYATLVAEASQEPDAPLARLACEA